MSNDIATKLEAFAVEQGFTPQWPFYICGEVKINGPSICPCGEHLLYRLTPAGVSSEVEHYEDIHFDRLTTCQAYEIAQMLFAAGNDQRVLGIARRAMEHLVGCQ